MRSILSFVLLAGLLSSNAFAKCQVRLSPKLSTAVFTQELSGHGFEATTDNVPLYLTEEGGYAEGSIADNKRGLIVERVHWEWHCIKTPTVSWKPAAGQMPGSRCSFQFARRRKRGTLPYNIHSARC
jgi:hypothetical protein